MAQQRETAMQRIQVGVVGLVMVLLFVSLANMVLDRAAETELAEGGVADPALVEAAEGEEDIPEEPLAELGAAPVVETEADAKAKADAEALEAAPEQNNVQTTDAPPPADIAE